MSLNDRQGTGDDSVNFPLSLASSDTVSAWAFIAVKLACAIGMVSDDEHMAKSLEWHYIDGLHTLEIRYTTQDKAGKPFHLVFDGGKQHWAFDTAEEAKSACRSTTWGPTITPPMEEDWKEGRLPK